jgi:hypothetical protein
MSKDSHEVLRCSRGRETRIYSLRVVAGGAELWRVTETPGEPTKSVKESDFREADEAGQFLEDVRRALRAGGWEEE